MRFMWGNMSTVHFYPWSWISVVAVETLSPAHNPLPVCIFEGRKLEGDTI